MTRTMFSSGADSVLDVADDRRVDVLLGHAAANHSVDKADQPATNDP